MKIIERGFSFFFSCSLLWVHISGTIKRVLLQLQLRHPQLKLSSMENISLVNLAVKWLN